MNKIQTLKGFRDFLPDEARKRQYIISILKNTFESFGFEPLETPSLEYEEILSGKYGEEGDKLMYKFEDNGGRKVALRYDQTVPLSRVVAQYRQNLPIPFKRYQIQPVWRAENTQKGRFREFLQCDIDTIGVSQGLADAEILAVIAQSYEQLGISNFTILVNDRSLFTDLPSKAIIAIDKLKKIGIDNVKNELESLGVNPNKVDELLNSEIPASLREIIDEAKELGVNDNKIRFEPTLARGLDYYTGIIIEVEIESYNVGSVGGGGRYDNLIGMFAGTQIPSVGFAFGFDRVMEAMEEQNLFPEQLSASKVLVTLFSPEFRESSMQLSTLLRSEGINTELYLDDSKMEKQIKFAIQKNIPYIVIIGSEEIEKNCVTLKNLLTREQKLVTKDELIKELLA